MPLVERRRLAGQKALDLLARRERSEMEIRIALRKKGFDAETIAVVTAFLKERRLLSDSRFAEAYATDAAAHRGYSSRAIRRHLRGRGVDAETASAATAASPEEEEARARAVAIKRARALAGKPPEVAFRRLVGFLGRRGYPGHLANKLARELTGTAEEPD